MAVIPKQNPSPAVVETVDEIMRIFRSLPPRPTLDEVEAAMSVLRTVNSEEQMRLDEISQEDKPPDVPEELFAVLQESKRTMVLLQSHEQKREAIYLTDLEKKFQTFDQLIQRASELVSGDTQNQKKADLTFLVSKIEGKNVVAISDESVIKIKKDEGAESKTKSDVAKGLFRSYSSKAGLSSGEGGTEKLSLMKVAGLIETSSKSGAGVLDLQGKLMDQIEWLPASIGKLNDVTELNLSENRIMALPSTIGSLKALMKLDVHANQLISLPDSFGDLINLTDLDLQGNRCSWKSNWLKKVECGNKRARGTSLYDWVVFFACGAEIRLQSAKSTS
uniref:Plant intracellular Ras-group-related LRR protein 5-like n=1 Tax=Nelumbo nucifera TaxID=4432 RepID=A0A822ZW19_NELNU|nr:TPA_asm: hypothetical protein HUJ06_017462 [Nelumbo nucifera]